MLKWSGSGGHKFKLTSLAASNAFNDTSMWFVKTVGDSFRALTRGGGDVRPPADETGANGLRLRLRRR